MRISVIIPVYNAENYLHKCLNALMNQTYNDFEIIIVNDGSQDKSGEICEQYASQDPRIRVFHKKNEGVSATRNFGVDNSENEWITFVDADDIVLENYLSDLVNSTDDNVDMVVAAVEQLRDNQKRKTLVRSFDGIIKKNDYQTLIEKLQIVNFGYVYSILYKKSIIRENNIKFDIRLAQSEDMLFILDYILHLKNDVKCIPAANYQYIMDVPNSGSKKKVSAESINLQLSSIYEMIAKRYKISDFKSLPILAQLLDYLYYKKLSELISQESAINQKVISLKSLNQEMILFFQNIRRKGLRAKLQDFLLLNGYYKLFLKLRNF